jgi:transposase
MITIGIDPHKSSMTAGGGQLHQGTSGHAADGGHRDHGAPIAGVGGQMAAASLGGRGRGGPGQGVAQGLVAAGEWPGVVDVPAQLAARARLLNTGHARKTDSLDAASVAAVAVHHPCGVPEVGHLCEQWLHAARSYLLIRPPSTG